MRIRARRVDGANGPVLREPEAQQGLEVAVALLLGGRAEHGGDHADASLLRRSHLRPAGRPRVAGLAAEELGQQADQVVGRRRRRGRRRSTALALPRPLADERVAQRGARAERRHLARWRGAPADRGREGCGTGCGEARAHRAFAFISATNRATEPPPACTARAVAASFALGTSAPMARSRTVIRSPGRRKIVDSPTPAASGVTTTTSSSCERSSATSTVISLVMLAIGLRSSGARAASTAPPTLLRTR